MGILLDAPPRAAYIGGSDIGTLLGVNPFKTPLQLWREKVGLDDFAPLDNAHIRRGNALEPTAGRLFTEETGKKLRRRNLYFQHKKHPFLGGHIDFEVIGERAIAEVKCPSLGAYAKIKREGLRPDYIAQMQWYLGLTGRETGHWIIFCADQWQILHFPVARDLALFDRMAEKAVAFWEQHVLANVPPAADAERDDLGIEAQGATQVYRDDPELVEAMRLLREAKMLAKEAATIEETAKARVKELIAEPGVYAGPGFRLHYRQDPGRTTFDRKALAGARPLDRLKVGMVLTPLLTSTSWVTKATIKEIDGCDIDLTQFEQRGEPFPTLRPYFLSEE